MCPVRNLGTFSPGNWFTNSGRGPPRLLPDPGNATGGAGPARPVTARILGPATSREPRVYPPRRRGQRKSPQPPRGQPVGLLHRRADGNPA
jgi:hypothetical protein